MSGTLIKFAQIVNEGKIQARDVRIEQGRITQIDTDISPKAYEEVIDASGLFLLPGMIDDQVHFREPGMPNKGTIYQESRAAVAGGITSFMEMPNVVPATTTREALQYKFDIARTSALANYAFYFGATNDNIEAIKRLDPRTVCGVKVFMGASTGNLLVDDPQSLDNIFASSPVLIVTHCEDNARVQHNAQALEEHLPKTLWQPYHHPVIRDAEACYLSSSYAVSLAKKHDANLHVLHLTTEKELALFEAGDIRNKRITAEACVHHLWFNQEDYARLGNQIKCNPAIKSEQDRLALINAVNQDVIDIIATDHAPHTWEEKQQPFHLAPAGLPLVQHALLSLLEQVDRGHFTLEKVVEKVCHNPAIRYGVVDRGFIKEGYYADLVLVDIKQSTHVASAPLHYLCQWTPFKDVTFNAAIKSTFVNGVKVFDGQAFTEVDSPAQALSFSHNPH